MKKIIIYSVKIMLVAERLVKRSYNNEIYFLAFYNLFILISTFIGTFIFLGVRLKYITQIDARNNLVPICILLSIMIPFFLIHIYKKKINVDLLKEQVNKLDIVMLKKERTKGIIITMLFSSSILISLSILSLLIKLNII